MHRLGPALCPRAAAAADELREQLYTALVTMPCSRPMLDSLIWTSHKRFQECSHSNPEQFLCWEQSLSPQYSLRVSLCLFQFSPRMFGICKSQRMSQIWPLSSLVWPLRIAWLGFLLSLCLAMQPWLAQYLLSSTGCPQICTTPHMASTSCVLECAAWPPYATKQFLNAWGGNLFQSK